MEDNKNGLDDLKQIRAIVERSSTFLSLSGFSGVIVGLIAICTSIAIVMLTKSPILTPDILQKISSDGILQTSIVLVFVAAFVLAISSAFLFSYRKSRNKGLPLFNKVSASFTSHFFVPLITGGVFIIVLTAKSHYDFVLPAMSIFYGLSLVSASKFTLREVSFLGISSLVSGLAALLFVPYGLLLWSAGFGFCTIGYGLLIYWKYER